MLRPQVAVNAADRQVHLRQPPGGVVRLLAVDADVAHAAAVLGDELLRLHEHAAGAAARIVDPAPVRRQHRHQQPHDAARGVELAALLALRAGELREEILVDAAQDVLGAILLVAQADVADQVNELAQALLVQPGMRVIFRQHALQRTVIALDGEHGVVHDLADGRQLGACEQGGPARLPRHPEDVLSPVFIGVFGIGALGGLSLEPRAPLLERVGDVLEEDQAEDDVLVLGRVHVAAQRVGGLPELIFETEVGGGAAVLVCHECQASFRCGCAEVCSWDRIAGVKPTSAIWQAALLN